MKTKIKPCTCVHKFQDETYGTSQRVCNLKEKDRKPSGWSCTICNAVKPLGSGEIAKVEVVREGDKIKSK